MTENTFLKAVERYDFLTENGAVSHASTGSPLVDYFAKGSTYRGRSEADVDTDLSAMWEDSPLISLMIIFYSRMITRQPKGRHESDVVAKGQGARDEFRRAMVWLARCHPDVLSKNLWLVPVVGSWKDLWHVDTVDVLDASSTYSLVEKSIECDFDRPLIAKYLPRIRSKSNTYNDRHRSLNRWAKGLCQHLGWTERAYREFKSDRKKKAHQFQRDMCNGKWDKVDFGRIPGRALFKMNYQTGKDKKSVIERHLLDRYISWLDKQPTVKFTGYPFELFKVAKGRLTLAQKRTFDKQFDGILKLAKRDQGGLKGNVWCALDTSGSMGAAVTPGTSAYDICIGLGIYFAALNDGAFRDHIIMFDAQSWCMKLKGSFTEKARQVVKAKTAWGNTNFQSVIDEIVRVRETRPEVPVADFPETLIVISDMQFDAAGDNTESNYKTAMAKLAKVGLPNIRIVWWWATGRGGDFPSTIDDEGVIMIGGFDGSVLTLLLGGEEKAEASGQEISPDAVASPGSSPPKAAMPTPEESMLKALDQELLKQLRV